MTGDVRRPERGVDPRFDGRHGNRLFITAGHSPYALFVDNQEAARRGPIAGDSECNVA